MVTAVSIVCFLILNHFLRSSRYANTVRSVDEEFVQFMLKE